MPMHGSFKFLTVLFLAATACRCGSGKTLAPAASGSPEAAERLYTRAMQAAAEQRYGEAIVLFETVEQTYPESRYSKPANRTLQACGRFKPCADAWIVIRSGGGMTFFPNMPTEDTPRAKQRRTPFR